MRPKLPKMNQKEKNICIYQKKAVILRAKSQKQEIMSTIVFQPQDNSQMAFLTDFAKRVSVPYIIVPVNVQTLLSREEKQAQKRANSFAELQTAFAGCDLTDEEIRQECEIVRQEMQDHAYAH